MSSELYIPLPLAVVVMGVSGCGKSSVGERLAAMMHIRFIEGDQLHPATNIEKMAAGIPLTDDDRTPWLQRIGSDIKNMLASGDGVVVSCSALKKSYRDMLRSAAGDDLAFVYLEGSREVLLTRMSARQGHFMPVSLLDNQLQVLEVPTGEPGVVTVNIDNSLETIVALARKGLNDIARQGTRHAD